MVQDPIVPLSDFALKAVDECSLGHIADFKAVVPYRSDMPAIGAESETIKSATLVRERASQAAGFAVPQANGAIPAGRGEQTAIGAESDIGDHIVMAAQRPARLTTGWVPDFDGLITAGRGKQSTIGAESDGRDSRLMAREGARLFVTTPLEIKPLPVAQSLWAVVQDRLCTQELVGGQFTLGRNDILKVELFFQPAPVLFGQLGAESGDLGLGPFLRLGRPRPGVADDGDADAAQQRAGDQHSQHDGHG